MKLTMCAYWLTTDCKNLLNANLLNVLGPLSRRICLRHWYGVLYGAFVVSFCSWTRNFKSSVGAEITDCAKPKRVH